MHNLGLLWLSLRSGISEQEKRDAIRELNDPDSGIFGMTASFESGGEGLNLHKVSADLVMKP